MKRLSKDERIGATAIALVALLICGGSFLWNRRERGSEASEEVVKTIMLASDSVDSDKESTDEERAFDSTKGKREGKKRQSKSENREKKRTTRKSNKNSEKKKQEKAPPRDYLSDPI